MGFFIPCLDRILVILMWLFFRFVVLHFTVNGVWLGLEFSAVLFSDLVESEER